MNTAGAIAKYSTLDSYNGEALDFFIPLRAMLPLLQDKCFQPHRPGEALSISLYLGY